MFGALRAIMGSNNDVTDNITTIADAGPQTMSTESNKGMYGGDVEKDDPSDTKAQVVEDGFPQHQTQRGLKQRHLSMLSMGGAIGVGLVIGSGTSLAKSGPGSLFVAYVVMGANCLATMLALGELSALFPSKKGFPSHASRFIDPALGFATAVVYLIKYLLNVGSQIVAGCLVIQFWNRDINSGAWAPLFLAFGITVNSLPVGWFGEIEFILCLLKSLILTGLVFLLLIIDLGGVPGQERIGFRYWKDGQAFLPYKQEGSTGQFLGFISALSLALYAYVGTELVGVTAGEASNPRKTFPKAVKATFFRIGFFYITGVFVVGLCVKGNSPLLAQAVKKGTAGGASASPFVVAIQAAGIRGLPGFINACFLMFTFSSSSSDLYIAIRTLYGLAKEGNAPQIFLRCTKRGLPWISLIFCASFGLLCLLVVDEEALKVFNYMTSSVALCGGISWAVIHASHIALMNGMRTQGVSRNTLPYKSPLQPYMSYTAFVFTIILCLVKGFDAFMPFDAKTFVTTYVAIPIFFLSWGGYRIWKKTKFVRWSEMEVVPTEDEFPDLRSYEDEVDPYKGLNRTEKIKYWLKDW